MRTKSKWGLLVAAAALSVSACGGGSGGGGGMNSIPTPPPAPAPPPAPTPQPPAPPVASTTLNLFASPPSVEFAGSGAAFSGMYSDPDPMEPLSLASDLQPSIRYDQESQTYQVELPDGGWKTLVTYDQTLSDWGRSMVLPGPGGLYMHLNYERALNQADPNPNSTIGSYFYGQSYDDNLPETQGWLAIGIPTSPSALPLSGTATYSGLIRGSADVLVDDGWGGVAPAAITGSTSLTFNFSASTLAGAMSPKLGSVDLGTFSFVDTVYSNGQYSGRFDTSVTGMNSFSGSLVGPNGEELIGAWALPFLLPADGSRHQAAGAWIAKQGN